MKPRSLSPTEFAILERIRKHYGHLNTPDEVMFTDVDEAVLWVKADDGSIPLMANLTNLAEWRADGTIDEERLRTWLGIGET